MTYDQLVTLDTIIKMGSFKAASKKLHKSQPSISVAIKKLEEEYQLQIFSREEYRPKLTEKGKVFYEKAKLALFHMQSLDALGQELAMGTESEIRVGVDAVVDQDFIFPKLREFFKNYPKTNLELSVDILSGTCERVLKGQTDIALVPSSDSILKESFDYIPISEVEMIPVISKKYFPKILSEEQLRNTAQIIVKSSGEKESRSYGVLEGGRHWPVTDINVKKNIIKQGLGWGGLPKHLIEKELETKEFRPVKIPGIDRTTITVFIIKNKLRPLGPIGKKLWEMFESL